MKACSKCKVEKQLQDFNKNSSKPDGLQTICRECSNKRSAAHYLNNKQAYRESKKNSVQTLKDFVFEYLSTHPCIDCTETDPVTLEFDHLSYKNRNVSDMIHSGVSLASLKIEIEKCVVRCANCHRKKTAKDFGWYKLTGPVV